MIVKDVMTWARTNLLDVSKHLVGLKPRVEEIKGLLLRRDLEGNDVVRMIGIYGMGGIGKTTLAKALHNEIARNFDACSFLFDVRETSKTAQGLRSLETQMIRDISRKGSCFSTETIKNVASHKKVLVVLDDVDHLDQLKALAGDCDWFGKGSRIIITTRDESVLIHHRIEEGNMKAINRLNDDQSMELFCCHAFLSKQPPDECYRKLADEVVCTTGGLPLALEVLGSQFFDMKTPKEWEDSTKKLKKYPDKGVYDRLRISYDGLDDCHKKVFLDIACFFIHIDKKYPTLMWEACDFYPSNAIKVLKHKSLIKMTNIRYHKWNLNHSDTEVFWMHDQIRDMGRNIVLQESSRLPGRRSRFWDTMTIEELQTMEEPKSVQGIQFNRSDEDIPPAYLWERHTQLRYLRVHGLTFQGNCLQLSASLKWLRVRDCEVEQMSSTYDFDPGENIVILELAGRLRWLRRPWRRSCSLARAFVEQSFLGRRKAFKKLKVLDLSETDITMTPNFSNVACPNVEKMRLCGCNELTTVHESIGQLKRLEILDLRSCAQISSLPITLGGMTSLKKLMLQGCGNLSSLPNTLGGMTSLEELVLDRTDIETLPDSIKKLRNLKTLFLEGCEKLSSLRNTLGGMTSLEELGLSSSRVETLPDSIGELRNLKRIFLRGCFKLSSLPNTLGGMTSLEELVLSKSHVETLPDSIGELRNLKRIFLDGCFKLFSLPNTLGGMTSLEELVLSRSHVETLPDSIGELRNLKRIFLGGCFKLSSLPNTLGGMTSLEVLGADNTNLKTLPGSIGDLINLEILCARNTQTVPDSIWKLTKLRVLHLSWCQGPLSLPETLADMTSLEELELYKVDRKNAPDSIGAVSNQHQLCLGDTCINALPDSIGTLSKLRRLSLRDRCIENLPESIGKLTKLRQLDLSRCAGLSSLPETFGGMTSLEVLFLDGTSIKTLPDSIGELANLRTLSIKFCEQLTVLPHSIRKLSSLKSLEIFNTPLKGLMDDLAISDLMKVGELNLSSCELLYALPNHFLCQGLRRLCLADPTVEALPESMGQWENLRELSLECKKLKALPESISSLQSLRKLEVSNCSNLSSLPLLPGMKNTTNNLKRLILPGPGGSLRCNNLNDHTKKTVLRESTFDCLCNFGLESETFSPTPNAGQQHGLCFLLPRYIPWPSCKEFIGELLFDGELCTVNDHAEAPWRAHVEVVADDGLTVIAWMPYTFHPGNTIVFRETGEVMQDKILGSCCNVHVFLELPEELKWIKMALNLNFLK